MDTRATWILWLKIFGLFALILTAFGYLSTVPIIFVPFIFAVILNVVLAPVVSALERRDFKRETAVMCVFLALGAVLVAAVVFLPEVVGREIDQLKVKWPQAQLEIMGLLGAGQDFINARVPADNQVNLVETIPAQAKIVAGDLIKNLPVLIGEGVVSLLLIPLFTFFLLRDGRSLKKSLVAAVPNRYFEMTLGLIYRVNQQVSNYLRGIVIEAIVDATIATAFCLIFQVPNAIVIGLVVGITTPIPVAGLVVSSLICPLIAIFGGAGDPGTTAFALTLLVWGAIAVAHLVDNVLIAPLVMGHSVHMHPIAVIVSIVLGSHLFGVLGIILAVPVVSVLKVLVQEGYRGIKSYEYYLKHAH